MQAGGDPRQAPASQQTPFAQARAPEQSAKQVVPVHEIRCVQESGFMQRMSHEGESHRMGPVHVSAAVHATLHLLPRQAICCLHAPAPMQLMLQALAAVQSMVDEQEPPPVQMTVHGIPGGQTMGSMHVPAAVHVTVQAPTASQVPMPASAQREGHASIALTGVASAASASRGPPSLETLPSLALPSGDVASASVAAASSTPNRTSGKEHAAATNRPALTNGMTRGQRFFTNRQPRPARTGPGVAAALLRRLCQRRPRRAPAIPPHGTLCRHSALASWLACTLIRSDSRPFSSVITRVCEGAPMNASWSASIARSRSPYTVILVAGAEVSVMRW